MPMERRGYAGHQEPEKTAALPTIGIVVLAAGASTRMGTPKQLLPYRGCGLLCRAVETALASVCRPVVVVLGAQAERLEHEVRQFPIRLVHNSHWADGMSSSIRAGIGELAKAGNHSGAAVLMLCDQPLITPQTLDRLVAAHRSTGRLIVASRYGGTVGAPALFHRSFFPTLLALEGQAGAQQIIRKNSRNASFIAAPEGAVDVDTPADYQQLRASTAETAGDSTQGRY